MSGFLGRYEYQMDEKGRVSLPAVFRRAADDPSFVLVQVQAPALTLFPSAAWEAVSARLLDYRRSSAKALDQVRWITSNAVVVSPDKQGRILVPSWLKEAAELDGPVLMIGAIDRVELWNPERFSTRVPDAGPDLGSFAPQIFG